MHAHDSNPDDKENAVVIPLPRKAPDDDIENLPQIGHGQPVWRYNQDRKRGVERRYSGYISHIHGADAERLRGELAQVVQELLDWAAQQQSGDHSTEDGEAA